MNKILKHFITWAFGAICGGLFVYAIVNPLTKTMLAGETQMSEQIQDLYSQVTIIGEAPLETQAQPGPEIPLLNGLATLRIGALAIPAQKLGNGTVWYIPMKVKPSYRGDASRAHVFYFDTKTQQLAGPFSPTVLP
jgi:hypothetical protein